MMINEILLHKYLCHTLLTAILPILYQGNSRGVNTWIQDFACKILGPSQNLTSSLKT